MKTEDIALANMLLERIKRLEQFRKGSDEPIKLIRAKDDVLQISGQIRQHSRSTPAKEERVREKLEEANGIVYGAVTKALEDAIAHLKEHAVILGVEFTA